MMPVGSGYEYVPDRELDAIEMWLHNWHHAGRHIPQKATNAQPVTAPRSSTMTPAEKQEADAILEQRRQGMKR